VPATPEKYLEVQNSDEFGHLRQTLRKFIFPTTIAFILWYALYVLLSAYARGFMGVKLIGNINVALVLGLLQFVSTFAIAWVYARYADKNIDPVADKIRADLDGAAALRDGTPADTTPVTATPAATGTQDTTPKGVVTTKDEETGK
jgi:uncharacterized membrane protein (DUF485 family)